jgi:Fur family ferric uptake transcriptional regulator
MKETPSKSSLESVRLRLQQVGLRSTAARIAVVRFLIAATAPLSHAEVADGLAEEGFDRATIYRNLIELTNSGLVSRIELGDHVWRFELKPEGQAHGGDHPHFVCVDCGEVTCLPEVSVDIKPTPGTKRSGIRDVTGVLLRGHCGNCS